MAASDPSPLPQPVVAPMTSAAIFLTLAIAPGDLAGAAARGFCPDLSGLVRSVSARDPAAGLTCVLGISTVGWDRMFPGGPRPAELHPFREFKADDRHAMATPGDLMFHIRANRMDLCYELTALIVHRLGEAAVTVDEVHGFRYFDDRDLIGFVDGTENPQGQRARDAALIGAEDPDFTGGSYVITQRYVHRMAAWAALPTDQQEQIIGRTKADDVELADTVRPTRAHNVLTVIMENGQPQPILRANMPYGRPGAGDVGTYFIGYCRTPRITELMIEAMFIGRPPGNYDRLLDFSRPVTGGLFFCPTISFLDSVTAAADPATAEAPPSVSDPHPAASGGSLGIGSLKGEPRHE